MNQYRRLLTVLSFSLLPTVPTAGTVLAQEQPAAIQRERLWLPASQSHLMPMLEYAAELALSDPDCRQVLYGRLNEFRSERGELAMTVLCQQDPRTTFNVVYQASDLEAAMDTEAVEFSEDDPTSNLEALRQLLVSNAELREQGGIRQTPDAVPRDTTTEDDAVASDDLDLELDLEDLLRERPRPSEDPPELF